MRTAAHVGPQILEVLDEARNDSQAGATLGNGGIWGRRNSGSIDCAHVSCCHRSVRRDAGHFRRLAGFGFGFRVCRSDMPRGGRRCVLTSISPITAGVMAVVAHMLPLLLLLPLAAYSLRNLRPRALRCTGPRGTWLLIGDDVFRHDQLANAACFGSELASARSVRPTSGRRED